MLKDLYDIARMLTVKKKGILAADESINTIKRRLDTIGMENSEENRRRWRQLLFTTPNLNKWISGVILHHETLYQKTDYGKSFCELFSDSGIVPGVKVDKSTHKLANSSEELITEGLDGLRQSLQEYYKIGARFTKWRCVFKVGDHIPTAYCIEANAHTLAYFAVLSQEEGFVPIVEPEVLMDGSHSIQDCFRVTRLVLTTVFNYLQKYGVELSAIILKPNMVLSGKDSTTISTPSRVASATLECFKYSVPAAVVGIAFLSGGQNDDAATENLDAINKLAPNQPAPWEMTFSYGRGLQATPLKVWEGKDENINAAQMAFVQRCQATSAARQGIYK